MGTGRAVVCDAFGTLVFMGARTAPWAQLRTEVERMGGCTQDWAVRVMTGRHTLAGMAVEAGVVIPTDTLEALQQDMRHEADSTQLYPDAVDALQRIAQAGHVLVVASNLGFGYGDRVQDLVAEVWRAAGGAPDQIHMVFSYDIGVVKPHPALYAHVSRMLWDRHGVGGADIVMVGDRLEEDVAAPIRAGWSATRVDRAVGDTLLEALDRLGV